MKKKLVQSIEYIEKQRENIIELEGNIKRIKSSKDWNNAMDYLRVAACRGEIDEAPTKKNKYRVPIISVELKNELYDI